jgi:hypothetical protein
MAETYKVLAQSNPSAATLTASYAVPSSTSAVVSSIVVCNRSATPTAFRISIQKANAADSNEQYIAYDVPIGGNQTITFTLGVTLAATDELNVYATLATLSFNVFGVEIT